MGQYKKVATLFLDRPVARRIARELKGVVLITHVNHVSMKKVMASGKPMPTMYPVIFAGSWLALGYTVGMGKGGFFNTSTILGLLAAGMVLVGMMVVLPWQRKNNVVDGPGLPLFVAAWGLLAAGNAIQ